MRAIDETGAPATTALDIVSKVTSGGEAGLLGIAFDPKFADNGFVYLHFDARPAAPISGVVFQSVIARYRSNDGGATFDPASEKRILLADQPFSNHNGGKIAFGPDGFLYISFGDGGSGGDPKGNGQNKDALLGKILRIERIGQVRPISRRGSGSIALVGGWWARVGARGVRCRGEWPHDSHPTDTPRESSRHGQAASRVPAHRRFPRFPGGLAHAMTRRAPHAKPFSDLTAYTDYSLHALAHSGDRRRRFNRAAANPVPSTVCVPGCSPSWSPSVSASAAIRMVFATCPLVRTRTRPG